MVFGLNARVTSGSDSVLGCANGAAYHWYTAFESGNTCWVGGGRISDEVDPMDPIGCVLHFAFRMRQVVKIGRAAAGSSGGMDHRGQRHEPRHLRSGSQLHQVLCPSW